MNKVNIDTLVELVEASLEKQFKNIDKISLQNQAKVLTAFQEERITEYHLKGTTGYGYSDVGRDALERVFARVLGAEAALVRGQIVSGTHAINIAFFSLLRPGDELLYLTGEPYDTLHQVIGMESSADDVGSLRDFGITFKKIALKSNQMDLSKLSTEIGPNTKMVAIQRSRGYEWRPSFSIQDIKKAIEEIKSINPGIIVFVDNCYGELVETKEPCDVGADLVVGSLIKNLGGGIAPTGAYIAGRADLVKKASYRWSAPGIGAAVGPSLDLNHKLYQGIFMAPHVVGEALKGALFAAAIFTVLGYNVSPLPDEFRTDLVQAIRFNSVEEMLAFAKAIQMSSPIDSHLTPEPWDMPGYDSQVVMAGGTFIQGGTMELSVDGPIKPPYTLYFQGGLSYQQVKLAILNAAKKILSI